jgi:streptogramin lyase
MEQNQIAARLRLALEREAAKHELSPGGWPRIERRLRRQTWRRNGIAAAFVAVAAAGATAGPYLWHAVSGPAASHPRPLPPLAVVGRTHLSHGGSFLAAGFGAIWVTGKGVVYRVDPASAQIVATIAVPGIGLKQSHIATGAGAVWVTGRDHGRWGIYRIDPRRNRIASFIRLPPTPVVVTVAYGQVWVDEPRTGPAVVFRIDPRTNHVSGPPIRVGTGGGWMVAGFGALWVTNGDSNGSVSRINPATGTVTRTLANVPDVTAAGAGSLWGTGNHGGVHRVDPVTGRVTATIGPKNAVRVIFWAGSAWVSAEPPGMLIRIDPASNRILGTAVPAGTSPIYITAAPSGLWVVDFTAGDLLHLAVSREPTMITGLPHLGGGTSP